MPLRIVITGVRGRMGSEILAAATGDSRRFAIAGGTIRAEPDGGDSGPLSRATGAASGAPIVHHLGELLAQTDAVIDFTNPEASLATARSCAAAGIALVCGTTGFTPEQNAELDELARTIPLYTARNTSAGIGALLALLPALATALAGYDVEIVETHHRDKKDAPSGTALMLAEAIAGERTTYNHGRAGLAPRVPGEIGIHAVRGGGNPGEHAIIFASDGEEVRISHRAFSRRAYAEGALRAALWLHEQPPGRYGPLDLQRTNTTVPDNPREHAAIPESIRAGA